MNYKFLWVLCLVYSKEGGSSFGVSNVGAVLAFHCHCVCLCVYAAHRR